MALIASHIVAEIDRCLSDIERDHGVRVLYACESGSRAWGFESQDSDYDVRFVYVRPREWYLSIDVEKRRDVIEVPINDELDVSGWDIRKTLQLFHRSNPPLNEWLVSPIVYRELGGFASRMRALAPKSYNPIAAHYHYLRMAANNFRSYLKGEVVRRKKYLYVLRPLLAVRWIESKKGIVPIEFDKLVAGTVTDENVRREIEELLVLKRSGAESDEGPRFPALHAFIEAEMERHGEDHNLAPGSRAGLGELNQLFRDIIASDAPVDLGA